MSLPLPYGFVFPPILRIGGASTLIDCSFCTICTCRRRRVWQYARVLTGYRIKKGKYGAGPTTVLTELDVLY